MFRSTIRRSTLSAIGRLQSTPTTTAARVTYYSTYRILSSDSTAAAASTTANSASPSSTSSYASQQTDSSFPQRRRRTKGLEWAIPPNPQLIALGDLAPLPGTMKKPKRVGRGPGSGLGKTAGKGHKGQGQRKGTRKRGFEGGSTPFWRRTPKLGMTNADRYWKMLTPLTVKKIQEFVKLGRIDGSQLITMKTLYDSGCLPKIEHGVKLLSGGLTKLDQPLHIQLTDCSEQSRQLLESNGGSVHLVWFNRMTLRAHLNPVKFLKRYGRLPSGTGVPPPKKAAKYGYVVEHVDY